MPERRWRVAGRGRGLFVIEVDDGDGFRAATTAEVDAALRQRRSAIRSGWRTGRLGNGHQRRGCGIFNDKESP